MILSNTSVQLISVQLLSRVRLFVTPWIAAHQAPLSITNSQSSLRLMSIESVMPSIHLILCSPLLLLPPIPPSIRVFSNESTLRMRWPNYWSFSFSVSPSKEIPGLISFRMDWLDLLAVQGTLKSLLQHHSSKASIIRHLYLVISSVWLTVRRRPHSCPGASPSPCFVTIISFIFCFFSIHISYIHSLSIHPSIIHLSSIHPSTHSSQTVTAYVPGSVLYTDSKEKREWFLSPSLVGEAYVNM